MLSDLDPTHFIFVRHGDYPRSGKSRSQRNQESLSALGRHQAESASDWVSNNDFQVDLIVHTPSVRARETAEVFAVNFPKATRVSVPSGFRDLQGLKRKLAQWCGDENPECVVFVGHDSSQSCLVSHFALNAKKADRTVIVLTAALVGALKDIPWHFHSGAVNPDSKNTHRLLPLALSI